jgi:4-amino-4-deoxy-L-arabinose transferase-like glycosyltransferase
MFRRALRDPIWAIVLLAILVRALVMVRGSGRFDDPDNYIPLARSLASGAGFLFKGRPTAYRPPLYPLMLAPFLGSEGSPSVLGIAMLHLALGAGTVWLTAAAAKGWGYAPSQAAIAALVTACDPVLVWQSRSVMTETPAAFLTALSLAALGRGGWSGPVLGGAAFGLAALCRPSLLAGAVLSIAAALVAKPGALADRLYRVLLMSLAIVLVLAPWTIRNALVLGEPVWTTTHGGYTLALANNPVYYDQVLNGPPGRVWSGADQRAWFDSVNRATRDMTGPEADRYLRSQVWKLARERPLDFFRAMLARLGHFWSVAPSPAVYPGIARWATLGWTIPIWVMAACGLAQAALWRWPRIAAPAVAIGLSLVHVFFWTDIRMRAPIVPAIALVAAGVPFFHRSFPGDA